MRLLLILLLTLQINSLKADEIFNLLKIPNLEVYKLNSSNGLKYLNAKKNFKIGFENNIKCNKANKKNLDEKFKSLGVVDNNVVFSCGSSVTAAVLGVAYSLINNKYMPIIYIGSWSEYGKIK